MPESWPVGVPHTPLAEGAQAELFRKPLSTDMEDGQQRRRRATTKNIATLTFTLRLDYTALALFKTWVRDTLVDGTLPFLMPIWVGGAYTDRLSSFSQPPRIASMATDHADVLLVVDVEDY